MSLDTRIHSHSISHNHQRRTTNTSSTFYTDDEPPSPVTAEEHEKLLIGEEDVDGDDKEAAAAAAAAADEKEGMRMEMDDLRPSREINYRPRHLPAGFETPGGDDVERRMEIRHPEPSWANMPEKFQLAILSLSRFADFFQMACLQAIMFHQLQSFDPDASDGTISWQAGILQGCFTCAQIVSAIVWGRVADMAWSGRKRVLLIGFIGTGVTNLGVAFSTSFGQAVFWRLLGGAVNGTVGAARTMVAESVPKRYHSRAFVLLPFAFNLANILGPIVGGTFAGPAETFPTLFGTDSLFGGHEGVAWMIKYPFAAPNLFSAWVQFAEAFLVYFFAYETHESRRHVRDRGLEIGQKIWSLVPFTKRSQYQHLNNSDSSLPHLDIPETPGPQALQELQASSARRGSRIETVATKPVLPFYRIWTWNVIFTMFATGILNFHLGAFTSLWMIFLSTKRYNSAEPGVILKHGPFIFSGGLSFSPRAVGFAMAIIGCIGVTLQLCLYPSVNKRLGVIRSFRYFLVLFPVAYFLAPYLSLIPSNSPAPQQASGFLLWFCIAIVLYLEVTGQTFAVPTSIILLNNCSPHPSVLGTIHGVGQSSAALSRTLGAVLAGRWYATGISLGIVGTAWWLVAFIAILGFFASKLIYEGNGHEIVLDGDEKPAR